MDPGQVERSHEGDRALPGRLVLGGEAHDQVRVDRRLREGGPDACHDPRVEGRVISTAHPAEHAVVAGLEREVNVRQAPAGTRRQPGIEQVVVHVLRLDRREPDSLHVGFGEDAPHEPGERQRAARVRAARSRVGPATVVRTDVDPGQDDLAVTGADRAAHVGEHVVGGDRAFGAACPRDDAVRAVERAAVLHLHERTGPVDPGPPVRSPRDLDAGEGGQRAVKQPGRGCTASGHLGIE